MKKNQKPKSWTEEQKEVINNFFKNHIKTKKAPKKHEVIELLGKHGDYFKNKTWIAIKSYVYNCYKNN